MKIIGSVKGSFHIAEKNYIFNRPLTAEDLNMTPEEVSDLVGDENARVSVSFGMADKEFGRGFDAHVTVSLTCHQADEVLELARISASGHAMAMMDSVMEEARDLWEAYERKS